MRRDRNEQEQTISEHSVPAPTLRRFRLVRSSSDRVVAGVAGGLGEQFAVDPVVVRLAFVVLAFAGGFGVLLYLFGWLIGTDRPAGVPVRPRPTAAGAEVKQAAAVGLIVAGLLLLLREAGLWFGDGLVLSVGLAAFGSAVIWTRSDDSGRARLARVASRFPRTSIDAMAAGGVSKLRLAGGALLIAGGMGIFLAASNALAAAGKVGVAVLATAAGFGLILGPWMWRLGRQLGEERRERIRSQERAELAAHLHDSVLQTLAMIQRTGDPNQMASLARGQERELRSWLYGRAGRVAANGQNLLSAALDEMAGRIERIHGVPVEVVTVGDCPMDDRLRALVDAAGEAAGNAAKHSGAGAVSVYGEVEPEAVRVYVRDQGRGFDPDAVPADRRGIAESIRGRMERHGGAATIASGQREGTEVQLELPRRTA